MRGRGSGQGTVREGDLPGSGVEEPGGRGTEDRGRGDRVVGHGSGSVPEGEQFRVGEETGMRRTPTENFD